MKEAELFEYIVLSFSNLVVKKKIFHFGFKISSHIEITMTIYIFITFGPPSYNFI